ncbi:MAG: tautomerase family protein [Beijerinckiaceae bacterium]
MPLVRISVPDMLTAAEIRGLADAVHEAMVDTVNVPANDRFQIITSHKADGLVIDPAYFGVERSPRASIVQITFRHTRTDAQKRALYREIAKRAEYNCGMRAADIMVVLTENDRIDWSFGDGIAQMSPEAA